MRRFFSSRRDAILAGSIAFALILVLITETLSAATLFAYGPLLSFWIGATCLVGGIGYLLNRKCPESWSVPREMILSDKLVTAYLTGTAVVLACVLTIALVAPPNTWDSMTYHMARVASWLQHRSVAHYPTANLRQLYLGPWAEFAIANLQGLSGSDYLANMVQFCTTLGSVLAVTAIAQKLGANLRGQMIAGLFVATIPIGIMEGSSTQTDSVAAFWTLCAINAMLLIDSKELRFRLLIESLFAAAVGLAFLTKATTLLYLAPFVACALVTQFRNRGVQVLRPTLLLMLIPLFVNLGQCHRNRTAFGSVLGPNSEIVEYGNSIHTPGALVSNMLRNILSNAGVPGVESFQEPATRLIETLSGLNASDPRITWENQKFALRFFHDEGHAGNPIHLLLAITASVLALCRVRKRPLEGIVACCWLCACFLFCFQLKWQPFITRLQLPLFAMAAPLVGLLLGRAALAAVTPIVVGILFIQSSVYVLNGIPRPMIGPDSIFDVPRADLYFFNNRGIARPYREAGETVAGYNPQWVGLISARNSWEYALRLQLPPGTKLVHLGVQNESRACNSFASPDRPPVIVQLGGARIPTEYSDYTLAYSGPDVAVLAAP
jgi:hypothetical protein